MSNPKPPIEERAFNSASCRCFYCHALLMVTNEASRHAVCSNNCDSKLVTLSAEEMNLVRYAWRFQKTRNSQTAETVS